MQQRKMVKNETYIENVWLRIAAVFVITTGLTLPIFLPIFLIAFFARKQSELDIFAYFLDVISWNHWPIWILIPWYAIWMWAGIMAMGEKEIPEITPGVTDSRPNALPARPRGNFFMDYPHRLGKEEALKRIQGLLGDVKRKHGDKITGLEEHWEGGTNTFRLTAQGYTVSGVLTVEPDKILLDGNIPFPASLAKGRIESAIREQVKILFT